MRKVYTHSPRFFWIFLIIALISNISLFSDEKKESLVYLEHADALMFDKERMPDAQILIGSVRFKHDGTYLYCDSAYFFDKQNSFNAYSNVKIVQGDTLFIYGDKLYYDGNTKMARLRKKVKMVNREVTLTTDSLNYDRLKNIGWYFSGGELFDKKNTLVSELGYYYPDTKEAMFNRDVVLTNPKFILNSDTLRYNTNSKIATILGPTNIVYDKEITIYSELGWYNTENETSKLLNRSWIQHIDGKHLTGDTLYYDKKAGRGDAIQNMVLTDSVRQTKLSGDKGYYIEKGEIGFATDSALIVDYSSVDTLYLHADTLHTVADSTYRVMRGLHNVRVYRDDIQAVSDSALYSSRDSIMHLFGLPILWNEDKQQTGDTIRMYLKNQKADYFKIFGNAMSVQKIDSTRYNQLSGKEMTGYLKDNNIKHLHLNGNVQTIFYPVEDDGNIVGLNKLESSYLDAYFKDSVPAGAKASERLDRIVFYPSPSGVLYPLEKIPEDEKYLKNWSWQEQYRPKDKNDVFTYFDRNPPVKISDNSRRRRKAKEEKEAAKKLEQSPDTKKLQ